MKTHVLILSKTFPKWHPRAGEPTYFKDKVYNAIEKPCAYDANQLPRYPHDPKLHTIRGNYERWEKIFEEIDSGEACLVLKQWSGVPYRSKQETIAVLTKEDGIGLQKLEFEKATGSYGQPMTKAIVRGTWVVDNMLANNDGLLLGDWCAWFAKEDKSQAFAIIQFTSFRY